MKVDVSPLMIVSLALLALATNLPAQTTNPTAPEVVTNLPPVITVLATDPNAAEDGTDPAEFQITRAGETNGDLVVFYSLEGTARNGSDYRMLPGWATIPTGSNSVTVTVQPILDVDRSPETNETVVLQLHPWVDIIPGRPASYAVGWPSNAVATIAESTVPRTNQPPVAHLLSPTADAGYVAPALINLLAQARDPDGTVTNVEFFAGSTSLGIGTPAATRERSSGYFALRWTNAPAGQFLLTVKATDNLGNASTSAPVTIKVLAQADIPTVTVVASDPDASEAGPDQGVFSFARTGDTTGPLTVYYSLGGSASNGRDYERLPGLISFPAGLATTNVTILPIPDLDTTPHTNDTVVLQLQAARGSSLSGLYQLGSPSNAVVTIAESTNAFPVVTVVATDAAAAEDGPDQATFQVTRTGNSNDVLSVYSSLGGTARNGRDYKMLPGVVTLPAGVTSTNITLIPILDFDSVPETNETVVVQLRRPSFWDRGSSAYALGWPRNAVATVAESTVPHTNQPPVVHLLSPADGAGFVAPAPLRLVAEAQDIDGTVTNVQFFAGNTALGSVTNSAAGSRGTRLFSLSWTNSTVGEDLLTAIATDNQGATSTSAPVRIFISSTALPVVSVFATDPVAVTGTNALGRTNTATIVLTRSTGTNSDLVVSYTLSGTASNGVDYVKLPGSITIPAGSRSATVSIEALAGANSSNQVQTALLTLQPPATPDQSLPTYLVGRRDTAAVLIVDRPLVSSGLVGGGPFHVVLPALASQPFSWQRSSNLVDWEELGASLPNQGTVEFVDPDAMNAPQFFYRIVPAPAPSSDSK